MPSVKCFADALLVISIKLCALKTFIKWSANTDCNTSYAITTQISQLSYKKVSKNNHQLLLQNMRKFQQCIE